MSKFKAIEAIKAIDIIVPTYPILTPPSTSPTSTPLLPPRKTRSAIAVERETILKVPPPDWIDRLNTAIQPCRDWLGKQALKWHDNYLIYYFHVILDALSLSYSLIKILFDLIIPENNTVLMHHLMMTPGGIIAIILGSLFILAVSFFAVFFDKKKVDKYCFIQSNKPGQYEKIKNLLKANKDDQSTDPLIIKLTKYNAILQIGGKFHFFNKITNRLELITDVAKCNKLKKAFEITFKYELVDDSSDEHDMKPLSVVEGSRPRLIRRSTHFSLIEEFYLKQEKIEIKSTDNKEERLRKQSILDHTKYFFTNFKECEACDIEYAYIEDKNNFQFEGYDLIKEQPTLAMIENLTHSRYFLHTDGLHYYSVTDDEFKKIVLSQEKLDQLNRLFATYSSNDKLTANQINIINLITQFKVSEQDRLEILQRVISDCWVYMREFLQALKYSYKGIRNIFNLINPKNTSFLLSIIVLPISIVVILNRILLRSIRESRKKMSDDNGIMLKNLQALDKDNLRFDAMEANNEYQLLLKDFYNNINRQPLYSQIAAFPMVVFNGAIDGLYLYFGFFALAPLGAALPPLLVLAAFYTLMTIISRVYEEYHFQKNLQITELQLELAILYKEILLLDFDINNEPFKSQIDKFLATRKKLQDLVVPNFFGFLIMGIKHGLGINSAVTSVMALAVGIMLLTGASVNPIGLIVMLSLGMVCLLIGLAYSLVEYHHYLKINETRGFVDNKTVEDKLTKFSGTSIEYKELLDEAATYTPLPPSKLYAYFELIRCAFSGLGKGQKTTDFGLNPLLEADGQGHYTDGTGLLTVAWILGVISAGIYLLRAFAKEFKDLNPPDEPPKPSLLRGTVFYHPTKVIELPITPSIARKTN